MRAGPRLTVWPNSMNYASISGDVLISTMRVRLERSTSQNSPSSRQWRHHLLAMRRMIAISLGCPDNVGDGPTTLDSQNPTLGGQTMYSRRMQTFEARRASKHLHAAPRDSFRQRFFAKNSRGTNRSLGVDITCGGLPIGPHVDFRICLDVNE